jgi:hypothetical protein
MPKIRVTYTVSVTSEAEYNDDNYPGQTLDEAVAWERNKTTQEIIEGLVEAVEFLSAEKIMVAVPVVVVVE